MRGIRQKENQGSITLFEVGPRDGLQNEKKVVSTADKLEFIRNLVAANFRHIEITSFVGGHKIPQMTDAEELVKLLRQEGLHKEATFYALVPNRQGLERALKAGIDHIAVFSATSDEFNRHNINTDIDGSLKRIEEVVLEAKSSGIKIRGYISTVFGCPYEGEKEYQHLQPILQQFMDWDLEQISLGDTIGVANPLQVQEILAELEEDFGLEKMAMHFHDTRGLAVANSLVALEMGVKTFDSSAGGLGGCPYAKGATGNVASEDLWNLFESMGYSTGIDIQKLKMASSFILQKINKETGSKYLRSLLQED